MGGRRVARGAGIDDRDPASGPAQDERGTEAGGPASDHHDVVGACVAAGPGEESEVVGELGRVLEGQVRRLARIRRRAQRGDLDDLAFPPGGRGWSEIGHGHTLRLSG